MMWFTSWDDFCLLSDGFFGRSLVVHKIQTKVEVLLGPKKLVFHKSYFAHEVKCAASKACLIEVIFVLHMFGRGSS